VKRVAGLACLALVVLAVVGGLEAAPRRLAAQPGTAAAQPTLVAEDIKFVPATLTVRPGTTITFVNQGALPHNFSLDALHLSVDVQPGAQTQFTIPATAKPGTYSFYCDVPGHREAGMTGTLVVAAAAATGPSVRPQAATAAATGGAVTALQTQVAALETRVAAIERRLGLATPGAGAASGAAATGTAAGHGVVFTVHGTGQQVSNKFTVPASGTYKLTFVAGGDLTFGDATLENNAGQDVYPFDVSVSKAGATATAAGSLNAGQYYVSVTADGSWTITLTTF